MNTAHAHGGTGHPAPGGISPGGSSLDEFSWWEWTFDPVFLIPLLLAVLYFRGYFAYRLRGGRVFPSWRPPLFALGVMVLAVALLSPIDKLADHSFTWHMVQHDLMTLIGVPLLLLGAPFIPVIRGIPAALRRAVFIPLAKNRLLRSAAWWLTHPLVAVVLFELTLLFWHFPPLYDRALFSEGMHYGMHSSFIFTAMLFWWNLINPHPFPSRLHLLLRMLMLFGSSVVNTALSSIITFSPTTLYGYELLPGFWGLTMQEDQFIGGALMWSMGAMLRLAAISILFFVYVRQENARNPPLGVPLETPPSSAAKVHRRA